jgi:hypothetical protein
MDEPVRVALSFPLSGQKLDVIVPKQWAATPEVPTLHGLVANSDTSSKHDTGPLDRKPS